MLLLTLQTTDKNHTIDESRDSPFSIGGPTVKNVRAAVVYIIAGLVVGGAEQQLLMLLENIDRNRFTPHLITFTRGRWEERFRALGIPIDIISYGAGKLLVFARCLGLLRHLRPSIVHTFGTVANFLGRAAAIAAGVPVIIPSERTAPFIKTRAQLIFDRVLAPFTTFWITNSNHAARFYAERQIASPSRIRVVHNAIKMSTAIPARGSGKCSAIGTIGDLRREKNHKELIEAMARVAAVVPDAILHIAGEGPLRSQIEAQVVRLRLERNVVLHGCVDHISEFLADLDIYVQASHYEGFPTAVMEAMAAGLPCVAFATTGCTELLDNEKNGLLVQPGNHEAFAQAILRLILNPNLAKSLGAAGRSMMAENFSIAQMVESTMALYESALAGVFS